MAVHELAGTAAAQQRDGSRLESGAAHERSGTIGSGERWVTATTGGLLVLTGLRMLGRRPIIGLATTSLGGYLLYRGSSGRCGMYAAAGAGEPRALSHPFSRAIEIREAVRIDRPADELFEHWRDFRRLPELLKHVERVEQVADDRFVWHFRVAGDRPVRSTVELRKERSGEQLAWESTEDSDVPHRGSISFESATGGRGTIVRVVMRYRPPAGAVGALLAKLLGRDPARQVRADLARFKQQMETGEIATNVGPSARDDDQRVRAEAARARRESARRNAVTQAGTESFPASDAPGWNP